MPTSIADSKNLLSDLMARYRNQVDYLAIRLEEAEGTDILLRGEKIETLSEGVSIGGQVRACHKGGWGFASFNRLSTLAERIEEAIAAAKLIGEEETILAPVTPVQDICLLPLTGTDPRLVPLIDKKQLCDRYAAILRSIDPRSPPSPCATATAPSASSSPPPKAPCSNKVGQTWKCALRPQPAAEKPYKPAAKPPVRAKPTKT
jgi:Predicted Zn-dependent proteases and their inactivated homologs